MTVPKQIGIDNRNDVVAFTHEHIESCFVMPDGEDEQWRQVTQKGLEDYLHHHDEEGYDELTQAVMELFGGLIAKYAIRTDTDEIIDLGCGVGRQRPIYVRKLPEKISYLGLDPIWVNEERDYNFLCAKVEDLDWINLKNRFSLALFATSLDHFLDIDVALNAVKKVMNQDGYMIFWIGLHDSGLVAEMSASRAFARIFSESSTLKRMGLLVGWVAGVLPRLLATCKLREHRLRKGKALDSFHFHYFLEQDIQRILSSHGDLVEIVRVPGTNSLFVVLKV